MGLSCWLEPPMLQHLKIQVFSDTRHEQNLHVSDECFFQPKNEQTFHWELGVPSFSSQVASTSFTAAM